ncbi:MAG: gliding motility protein GldB [Prevotella sp.]|nr:gliding motility protein GldB [Prevotella sp.]
MRKIYFILLITMLGCIGCEWQLKSDEADKEIAVDRYDRIQSLYLTTGDFSALQQMNTAYPTQTRTLIEDVLRIGKVNETDINMKFLRFYQDSTLQMLINEAEQQYASMDDINQELTNAFQYLLQYMPNIDIPVIYAQIGSLDQSIIVGNGQIGICLDKYLGADYALYQKEEYGYSQEQKNMMQRQYIVPDCIGFYLLSLYPMPFDREMSQEDRDVHMAKIQWVVNQAVGRVVFNNTFVSRVDEYMKHNKNITPDGLLANNRYELFQ